MRMLRYLMISAVAGVLLAAGTGCHGRASIPNDAIQENVGTGHISYTANQPGNVYVLDTDSNDKVFEGHVNNGDQVVVDPGADRIVVGGNNVNHTPALNPNHRYAIYFRPGH